MAEKLYLQIRFVLVIPLALLQKKIVARDAPRIRPMVRLRGIV
jgi:hypothetical protein